jgi:hypothetical protein
LPAHNRPLAKISGGRKVRMKGVAAVRTAKRQTLTAGLIDTPAVVAGPRGISGIDLDHFETRALGFVAEYVEEPRVSPRTVVIEGLPATRPGACPDPVQPLSRRIPTPEQAAQAL